MRELVKKILIKLWPTISPLLKCNVSKAGIAQRLSMAVLKQEDLCRWRVEKARMMGAKIGENCRFYSLNMFSEPYLIEIGDNVIVSGEVIFITHDGGVYLFRDEVPDIYGHFGRIKIGSNCFIGMGAIILPNVEIGDNCIVAAGSVVADSFPDNSVIMGNPARVIFNTAMYKKMRLSSKLTLKHEPYCYPKMDYMPFEEKKDMLMRLVATQPIRKPKNLNMGQNN